MRKRILCVLTLSMLLILMPVFAACDAHEHTYKMDHDDTQHWEYCTGCSYRSESEPHIFGDDNVCDECEYVKSDEQPGDHDHDWDITVTKEATCTLNGSQTKTCKICDKKEVETIAAPGHDWKITAIYKEATCTTNGEGSVVCTVCQTTETNHIFGFSGHQYGEEFIVDKEPSEFEYGYQSRHCSICSAKTDITAIDPTGELRTATYRIYVNRADGRALQFALPITIKFPEGNVRHPLGGEEGYNTAKKDSNGLYYYDVTLPLDTYEVSLGASAAVTYDTFSYTISPSIGEYPFDSETKYPTLDIRVKSHPVTNPSMKLSGMVNVGDIVSDFKFTDIDGNEWTLSQLLKGCKLLWINFYFNNCGPCQNEIGAFKGAYNKYKDDVTVVCFNGKDSDAAIISGARNIFGFPSTFILASDLQKQEGGPREVMSHFNASMPFPTHVFIDNSGYVCESFAAGKSQGQFEAILKQYIDIVDNAVSNSGVVNSLTPSTLSEKLNFPTAA